MAAAFSAIDASPSGGIRVSSASQFSSSPDSQSSSKDTIFIHAGVSTSVVGIGSSADCCFDEAADNTSADAVAPAARAIDKASRPEGSQSPESAPASTRSAQMDARFFEAASMSGVIPAPSRASRSSPRRICSFTTVSTPASAAMRKRGLSALPFSLSPPFMLNTRPPLPELRRLDHYPR